MPILEFATINLKPGVKPDDARLVAVLHSCITSISQADGVSGMRFIKNVPQGAQEQILGLVGIWATVEAHEAFSQSEKMLPLLVNLKDLIQMRGVAHLGVGDLPSPANELMASNMISASLSVTPMDHEKFQGLVEDTLQAVGPKAIAGWKIKKEESFRKAEEFGRKELGQGSEPKGRQKVGADGDADVWAVFVREDDAALVDELVRRTESLAIGDMEVQHWTKV